MNTSTAAMLSRSQTAGRQTLLLLTKDNAARRRHVIQALPCDVTPRWWWWWWWLLTKLNLIAKTTLPLVGRRCPNLGQRMLDYFQIRSSFRPDASTVAAHLTSLPGDLAFKASFSLLQSLYGPIPTTINTRICFCVCCYQIFHNLRLQVNIL